MPNQKSRFGVNGVVKLTQALARLVFLSSSFEPRPPAATRFITERDSPFYLRRVEQAAAERRLIGVYCAGGQVSHERFQYG